MSALQPAARPAPRSTSRLGSEHGTRVQAKLRETRRHLARVDTFVDRSELERIIALNASGRIDRALDVVFRVTDVLMRSGFSKLDQMLRYWPTESMHLDITVGLLTATRPAIGFSGARDRILATLERLLIEEDGPEEAERVIRHIRQ